MKAAYVQDNPAWYQITGEPGDPIGAGETFVISGSYPDEMQRSTTYPGGEIVYRYTGPGTAAAETRDELAGAYEKEEKEWDGVMPHAPISLDAAAAMKYAGEKYRSVYFAFNFYYIQEPAAQGGHHAPRARVARGSRDRARCRSTTRRTRRIRTSVVAQMYSETLDPSRVKHDVRRRRGPGHGRHDADRQPERVRPRRSRRSRTGRRCSYYLSAANLDGTTTYHPQGAPAEQHTFRGERRHGAARDRSRAVLEYDQRHWPVYDHGDDHGQHRRRSERCVRHVQQERRRQPDDRR